MNMTPDQIALAAHLAAIKAKTLAWVAEDPKNRWACYPVEDVAHWEQYGVFSVAQYEHHNLVGTVYEQTRSVFGYKPDFGGLESLSTEALKKESEFLSRMYEQRKAEQRQARIERKLAKVKSKAAGKVEAAPFTLPAPQSGFPLSLFLTLA